MEKRGGDLLLSRREKFQRLRDRGIEPFPHRYRRTHTIREAVAFFRAEEANGGEETRTAPVSLGGRIMALRGMGKASFIDLQDGTGHIQAHLRRDALGDDYDLVRRP